MRFRALFISIICGAWCGADASTTYQGDTQSSTINIAIIGAGAAGSSAAYYLSRYAKDASIAINITVFERESYVGGRSTTINLYNDSTLPVELGASIFVKVNHILVEATKTFNLSTSSFGAARTANSPPSLGIFNGHEFVLRLSSDGPTWWDAGKLLLRYGLSPIKTMRLMKSTVGSFLKMYDEPVFPFASLQSAVEEVDLLRVTSSPGIDYLLNNGISAQYAHDVIQASTRVNYAQNLQNFHGLETMVCMATDGAMAIDGGNWQLFQHMIDASTAVVLLNKTVEDISEVKGGYQLTTADSAFSDTTDTIFGTVIIAAPYQYSDIRLPHGSIVPPPVGYVRLHVTILASPRTLSPTAFHLDGDEAVPRTVLTTTDCVEGTTACFDDDGAAPYFYSISLLRTLTNPRTGREEYAYKIFSPEEVSVHTLALLFDVEVDELDLWTHRKVWHSYPLETPISEFADIELNENLYYTGGMESFISTMETNALMGKNIAKLISDKWESTASFNEEVFEDQTVL